MRRWPSFTYTTATITASTMIGRLRRWNVPELAQARTPTGSDVRIDAKMISDWPLPIPRCVINSPIHISSVVPAVSVTTIRMNERGVRLVSEFVPPSTEPLWNRIT